MQKAVLNCYQYFCNNGKKYGAVNETGKALKMGQSTVLRIVRRGEVRISRRGSVHQGRDMFKKVNGFWKKLIWEIIYNFYKNKTPPTIDALYRRLKEISTGVHYEFPCGRTTLYHLLKTLDFKYQKADNQKVLMETTRIVTWRWENLRQIEKHRSEGYPIVYLVETLFDSHDTARMVWSDDTKKIYPFSTPFKSKQIVIWYTGGIQRFCPQLSSP